MAGARLALPAATEIAAAGNKDPREDNGEDRPVLKLAQCRLTRENP